MAHKYIKPVLSPEEAIKNVKEGMSVMIGGFNYGGVPYTLVEALEKAGTKNLTTISNDTSYATVGHGRLIAAGQVKKVIASHIGINKKTGEQYNAGTLELELVPQGTFVERIRCGAGHVRRAHPLRRFRHGRIPHAHRPWYESGRGQAGHRSGRQGVSP